jgi:oligopeptide/dipeptide ABC transporter ATP-binding protein
MIESPSMKNRTPLLQVRNLKTYFFTVDGIAKAVDDVSIRLDKGKTLGLVGESGCGKSVTAMSIIRLIKDPPGKIVGGNILFDGQDLLQVSSKKIKAVRGKQIAMIFQEPMTALNPVYKIGDQIAEMLKLHENLNKRDSWDSAVEMLKKVQIPSPEKRAHDYPHQLSGGMRQRVMIAMALSCTPKILIADEPTTALDVTVQAQIMDLMLELKEEFGTAILLITHDLGVIAEIAERVDVMYAGRVVEEAGTQSIFEDPKHPYTRGMLKSLPRLDNGFETSGARLPEIKGIVPSFYELPAGCSFHPRCRHVMGICRENPPVLIDIGGDHLVRCHLYAQG